MNSHSSNIEQEQLNKQLQDCKALLFQGGEGFLTACQTLIQQVEKGDFPLIEAKAKLLLGEYYLQQRAIPTVIEITTPVLALAEKHEFHEQVSKALHQLGFCQSIRGIYTDETLQLFHKALAACEKWGDSSASKGLIHQRLASVYRMRSEIDLAKHHFQQAIHFLQLEQKGGNISAPLVWCYGKLGAIAHIQGNILQSFHYLQKALQLAEQLKEPYRTGTICQITQDLANIYLYLQDYAKAHEYIDKTLQIALPVHNILPQCLICKGHIFQEEEKLSEALQSYQKALKAVEQNMDKNSLALIQWSIGRIKRKMGALEEAQKWIQTALQFFEENQQTAHAALCQIEMGILYNDQKQFSVAIEVLEQVSKKLHFPTQQATAYQQLAVAYKVVGNWQKSHYYLEQFIENHENMYGAKTKELLKMQHQYELSFKEKEMEILQLKHRELKELDELKSRFFTHISHELRTPLTLILGPAESLLQDHSQLQDHHIQYAQTIRRNGKNMLQLIDEVLTLSKLNVNKIPLEETNLQLYPTIQRIFQTFQSAADFKKQHYQLSLWIDRDLEVCIDGGKLEKILNNLLSNAIKYTPEKGEILMAVEELEENQLQIKVKDSGRGIHPDDMPHIFDHYFQTRQKDLQTVGGVGVGLALVKELVELMGGTIRVQSKWQQGSTFILRLPKTVDETTVDGGRKTVGEGIVKNPEQSFQMSPSFEKHGDIWNEDEAKISISHSKQLTINHESSIVHRETVFLVEDHSEMLQYISSILSPHYQLQTARNGLDAWEVLQQENHGIDLIVSDVMMPKMDGFALVEKIKETPSLLQVPIILLTARSHSKDKLKALTMGIDDYLLKPFIPQELLARIQNLLKRKTSHNTSKNIQKTNLDTSSNIKPSDLRWLQSVKELVEKELNSANFSLSLLADELNISKRQLQRRIRKISHLSASEYVREIKLQTAREYLEEGIFETLSEVSYSVGFNTVTHFSRIYQKRFGKHPHEFFS